MASEVSGLEPLEECYRKRGSDEMHIGLFTDCYTPQVNGVVRSVKLLEEELRRLGHRVTVITIKIPDDHRLEEIDGHILRIPSVPFRKWSEFRLGIPMYNETYRKIKKLKLDVIHTHTEFTVGLIGKHMSTLMDIPIVHTYHTMYEDYSHYVFDHKYGKRVVKKLITTGSKIYVKRYDSIIAPTSKTRQALRSYGVRNVINIIPTGIDLIKFKHHKSPLENLNLRRSYGLSQDDYLLLSLGRLSKEKSVDRLIDQLPKVLRFVPKAKLLIVGDGPYKSTLMKQVKEMGLEEAVVFTGQVPFEEVGGFYCAADLFVNASPSETQGLTIVEAIASKLPVVVYDDLNVEGLVMRGATGRLFKTEEGLGNQIIGAYNNDEETRRMADKAYVIVQGLSKESYALNVQHVYEDMVKTMLMVL